MAVSQTGLSSDGSASRELQLLLGAAEALRHSHSVAAYCSSHEVECKIAPLSNHGLIHDLKYVKKNIEN